MGHIVAIGFPFLLILTHRATDLREELTGQTNSISIDPSVVPACCFVKVNKELKRKKTLRCLSLYWKNLYTRSKTYVDQLCHRGGQLLIEMFCYF
jgi:hypothetical protein